jgi:hypothetical protein
MTHRKRFLNLKTLKSTTKCHKLTLVIQRINIFRFKMENDPIWAYNQMAKSRPHCRKKPKIDLWEITGCAQIQGWVGTNSMYCSSSIIF